VHPTLLIGFVIRQPDVPLMPVADLRVCTPLLQRATPAHLTYRRSRASMPESAIAYDGLVDVIAPTTDLACAIERYVYGLEQRHDLHR
jgi:hypothetical protein